MNQAQRDALEALTGRSLTASEIAAIDAVLDARNDVEIASILSADRMRMERVAIADIQARLQSTGEWWSIKIASMTPDHPQMMAAVVVMDVANARYSNVDMTLPLVGAKFGELVTGGVMSQGTLDFLMALAGAPDPIDYNTVSAALNVAEGRMTL